MRTLIDDFLALTSDGDTWLPGIDADAGDAFVARLREEPVLVKVAQGLTEVLKPARDQLQERIDDLELMARARMRGWTLSWSKDGSHWLWRRRPDDRDGYTVPRSSDVPALSCEAREAMQADVGGPPAGSWVEIENPRTGEIVHKRRSEVAE